MQRNRLADQTSPYLRQHAENPVDWYPWGAEALHAAEAADKPILLSIGYSACHWCHVMAHESFEDPGTAAVMNELFINIKVDREERPDLDKIYQVAQQLLTQRNGGWPLTMFLTPQQQPFFGGTYFPQQAGHGLPGFSELLRRVAEYYRGHREAIRQQNAQLMQAFAAAAVPAAGDSRLDAAPLAAARTALEQNFDANNGGFTAAPKFPHPGSIERCLRHWYSSAGGTVPDLRALYMATLSLTRMAEGGLYDQLAGGFARYAVDAAWRIPHFEKMLYDNAQLLGEYSRAALATGETMYARIAGETADWVLRDLRSPQGGFYSSLDADSEGHEGRFYVWRDRQVRELLSADEYAALSRRFGLDGPANFADEWHLHVHRSLDEVAAVLAAPVARVSELIDAARLKLLAARNLRVAPARDEKILTAWNALTVKGLAIAARVLQRDDLAHAATDAVDFLWRHSWRDGRLLAACKDGRAHLPAYLDDYAFLADALLELLQTRWRSSDLHWCRQLADVLLAQFEDADNGGFFFTARDHERLIHRSKTFSDDALPSGNAVAASVLGRLGCLLGESRYLQSARRTLAAAWPALLQYPRSHMSLLDALEDTVATTQILVIRGSEQESRHWARALGALYAPRRMLFAIPAGAPDLPPGLVEKQALHGTVAYLCTGMTCSAPLHDLAEISRALASRVNPPERPIP